MIFALRPAPEAAAKGLTCDYYDIPLIPEGWSVSIPPGFNERKNSIGHFINEEKECAVAIQVAATDSLLTLTQATRLTETSLELKGATILDGPDRVGDLSRFKVTVSGQPSLLFVGTDSDVIAITVISGDREECCVFLDAMRNASPLLIPASAQVVP